MQGLDNVAEVTNKSMAEVNETKEGLQGPLGHGNLPLFDGNNRFRVGTHLSIPYNQSKVLDFWFFEEALFGFQAEIMIM